MAYRRRTRVRRARRVRKTRRGMRSMATRRRTRGSRRRITQGSVFTFTRQTEVALFNDDPILGNPGIYSTDNSYMVVGADDVTTNTVALPGKTSNFGIQFADRLAALQNMSDYTNMFQYYRIKKIIRKIVPVYGPGATNAFIGDSLGDHAQIGYPCPTLMVLADADSNEPVTAALARETSGVRRVKMSRTFVDSWRPKPNMVVGGTSTGGSIFAVVPKSAPWLNIDEASNVQHYGRRYGIIDWPGPTDGIDVEGDAVRCMWRIYTTYVVEFKGVR